jgi:hypothetical protein
MRNYLLPRSPILLIILLSGLLLRIVFVLYGASFYYNDSSLAHFNGDSNSYMWAFENLLHKGHYSFDFLEPDASFGRLPGYPFFYGLHYLIFGPKWGVIAAAWTQTLLDASCVLLIFHIIRYLAPNNKSGALVGAALYATYPFIIIWTPVIGTESLATNLTLLWLYALLTYQPTVRSSLFLGLLVAVCLFVREYLGILLPITAVYLLLKYLYSPSRFEAGSLSRMLRGVTLICLGFGLLYIGWPIRNYLYHGKLMLVKTKTAGYANYTPDVDSYFQWVHAWTYDENVWLAKMLNNEPILFPSEVLSTSEDRIRAQQLVDLARSCGSGFYVRRTAINTLPEYRDTANVLRKSKYRHYYYSNCNEAIRIGFSSLEQKYAEQHPWKYRFAVPLQNLQKALFKSETIAAQQGPITVRTLLLRALFGYRTLLLLLSFIGLWYFKQIGLFPVLAFSAFMYLFISFMLRGLEMRYLLQADVILLIPAALLIGSWLEHWMPTYKRRLSDNI